MRSAAIPRAAPSLRAGRPHDRLDPARLRPRRLAEHLGEGDGARDPRAEIGQVSRQLVDAGRRAGGILGRGGLRRQQVRAFGELDPLRFDPTGADAGLPQRRGAGLDGGQHAVPRGRDELGELRGLEGDAAGRSAVALQGADGIGGKQGARPSQRGGRSRQSRGEDRRHEEETVGEGRELDGLPAGSRGADALFGFLQAGGAVEHAPLDEIERFRGPAGAQVELRDDLLERLAEGLEALQVAEQVVAPGALVAEQPRQAAFGIERHRLVVEQRDALPVLAG